MYFIVRCLAKREFKVLARFLRQRRRPRLGTGFGRVSERWSCGAEGLSCCRNPCMLNLHVCCHNSAIPLKIFILILIGSLCIMDLNMEGLTLEEEGMTLNLEADADAIKILDHCLIGRVLIDKQIRFQALQDLLAYLWQPVKEVAIKPLDQGKYLFQFHHKLDVENVLDKGSWSYDNGMIILQRIAPGMVPKDVALDKMEIWIQVHNLPFGFMQEKVGKTIGGYLGDLIEYDAKNDLHSKFMRLRVRIDVNLPLKKEWQVRTMGGGWVTINFKYERLGIFCFMCGVVGHTDKKCSKLFELEADDGVRGWGNDIKPEIRRGGATMNRWLKEPQVAQQRKSNDTNGGSGNRGENQCSTTNLETNNDGVNASNKDNDTIITMGNQYHNGALIIKK
ncbi:hypothetical protein A2U01_0010114, partial [Trifolium medium]|nr:hypothetical protein [Trifolium medium]